MIDGFGVPAEGWHTSIYAKYAKKGFVDLFSEFSRPISADLGVKGVPQSATGQTALFTGLNAAEVIGRHSQGFPGPTLRKLIRQQNLFSTLIKKDSRLLLQTPMPGIHFRNLRNFECVLLQQL